MPPSISTASTITEPTSSNKPNKVRRSSIGENEVYHKVIYCPVTDITFEGHVRNYQQLPAHATTISKLSPSLNYIKHGKGTIHDHKASMTLSGYFQNDELIGHGLQTLYETNGRNVKAQYEGPFIIIGPNNYVRNGMGKYSWTTVGDTYYGDFVAGVIHGRGTFTWSNGDSYKGMFKKGVMQGEYGIQTISSTGDVYEGPFKKGKPHGWGKKHFGNGDVFEGMYRYEHRMGFGTYTCINKTAFVGKWNGCNIEGRGLISRSVNPQHRSCAHHGNLSNEINYPDAHFISLSDSHDIDSGIRMYFCGDTYRGEFLNGLRSGYGCYKFVGGDIYEGHFSEGQYHGLGVKYMSNGDVFDGEWCHGKARGFGIKIFHLCGDIYRGYHENDERHGYGVYRWINGHVYEGDFEHDQLSGIGRYEWNESTSYQGEWNRGIRSGPGVFTVRRRGVTLNFLELWRNEKRLYRSHILNKAYIPSMDQLQKKRQLIFAIKNLGRTLVE